MAETGYALQTDFDEQIEQAIRRAREADRVEPRAERVTYDSTRALVIVELRGGYAFCFPPECVDGLEAATADELSCVQISPSGDGLQWEGLDVHVSLTGLMLSALSLREWAARIMGQSRSESKRKAARANGLKGGEALDGDRPAGQL